jgi:shikimate kinase
MNMMIILIGPLGAGKSTVGRLLAAKLSLPLCSVDEVRTAYYAQVGYEQAVAAEIAAVEGFRGVMRYSKPFEVQMVAKIVAEHHGIIDFGASNSVYDDKDLLAQVENALAPFPNVFLLLPSADVDESAAILQDRLIRMLEADGKTYSDELFELNEYFIRHPANYQLAKQIIYTKDKTPESICNEIAANLA